MLRALWSGATGMAAQQFNIDNISNNLSNVNTSGYKKQRVQFQDLYYQNLTIGNSAVVSLGSGVRVSGTDRDFRQGALEKTDDPLSLAVEGQGFFTIVGPNGENRYTRDGSFRLDSQGKVVTSQGYEVKIEGAAVIPPGVEDLTVDKDGVIYGKVNGAFHQYGKIVLTMFPNPAGLEAVGSNLYRETTQSGTGVSADPGQKGAGLVLSCYLENSNVEIVTEMVNLIVAQRAFELNSKSVEAADQMWAIANNIRR